jgi:hypothetical protein
VLPHTHAGTRAHARTRARTRAYTRTHTHTCILTDTVHCCGNPAYFQIQDVLFRTQLRNKHVLRYNNTIGISPPSPCNRLSQLRPPTLESRPPFLLGHCSCHLWKICAGANIVHSWAEHVEHYFSSKLFAAVCEAIRNTFRDKEVPNKTTVHKLVTFRDTRSVCDWKHVWLRTLLTGETLRKVEETLQISSFVLLCWRHQSLQLLL